ncbi:DUF2336 domain-containing protein [Bosea sp. (in: a-proteobacteria)]|uniref:DUF2336 domain-containing protein n=1 Tax=Bosea sp. (in: a-proteobacteria) TaxID=1871050 RepID=UPI002FC6E660
MPSRIAADLAQLAHLASGGGLDLRQVALRVKADLLLSTTNPPAEDMAAFREMAVALIPVVDEPTALILARKLAGWRHVPPEILTALRARGGEVLAALIGHGMPLSPVEIEEIAAEGDPAAQLALAGRRDLSAAASTLLAGRDDRAVDLALVGNLAVVLPRAALDLLVARAGATPALGLGLLARDDLPAAELAPLFLQASLDKRLAMIEAATAHEALAPSPRRPTITPEQFAGLVATALVDRHGAFAALADLFGAGAEFAQALASDHSRQLSALTLVGCGASPEEATRFLIGLGDDTALSVQRIFALADLMRLLNPATARRLALQIGGLAEHGGARPALQPAMDPSGTPARAGGERPAARSSVQEMLRRLGGKTG